MKDKVIEKTSQIISTIGNLIPATGAESEITVLKKSEATIEVVGYDNWDGGTTIYGIFFKLDAKDYVLLKNNIPEIENSIKSFADEVFKSFSSCFLGEVKITPRLSEFFENASHKVSSGDLNKALEELKNIMISVATGGPQIKTQLGRYNVLKIQVDEGLKERKINNPITFTDLWQWYSKWSTDLPNYASRRQFVTDLVQPTIDVIKNSTLDYGLNPIFEDPTGWERVDRTISQIKNLIISSKTEEDYQTIGLLCREVLITVAQQVYDADKHPSLDGVDPSSTDAKRMLDAYLAAELSGGNNENLRRHAKASLVLANDLTHKRTADFKLVAICAEATNSLINIISIISEKRKPSI